MIVNGSAALAIYVAGSAFAAPLAEARRHRALLNCADAIGLVDLDNGQRVRVRVDLGGDRRWIAFQEDGGPPCVGYQETVGAERHGFTTVGGSNRKVLAWLADDGSVRIGEEPK